MGWEGGDDAEKRCGLFPLSLPRSLAATASPSPSCPDAPQSCTAHCPVGDNAATPLARPPSLALLAHIIGGEPHPSALAALGSRSRPRHESFISQSQWCVLIGRLPTLPPSSLSRAVGQSESCSHSTEDVFGLVPMWAKKGMRNTKEVEIL